ncbi:MAG: cation:proton antiporter [Acidimicrobiales bacterium]
MFATTVSVDLARLLLDLLIVLVAAKLAGELCEKVQVPGVLGEIAAGILIGPSVLGLVDLTEQRGVSLSMLAEIGVLLLLLSVGMEMDLAELGKVGTAALAVAVVGVVLPFAAGAGAAFGFGMDGNAAIFFGAALTATSVGITARVFGDLRALATVEARIVLGAAVADDVLGLIILTVVVKLVTGGDIGVGVVGETLGLAVLFLIGTGIVGVFVVPRVFSWLGRLVSSTGTLVVAGFALMIAFAELADAAKLAFIIGAFMAGLGLGRTEHHEKIAGELGALSNVLVPVFFVSIGLDADLEAMAKPSVLGLAAVMTVIAVIGKVAAGWAVRGRRADRLLIGMGMIPRGEVGLIFASIGLANAVLDEEQYGALLIVILLSTVMTPPLLRWRLGRTPDAPDLAADVPVPDGGWVEVVDGEIRLRETPPVSATVAVALASARLAGDARPSDELLDWFGTHRNATVEWSAADTTDLVHVLQLDEPRAWRFLDVTGVLDRALPEVSSAMARRRADMTDLDPLGALRFPIVDRLTTLIERSEASLSSPSHEHLALAAFVADVGGTSLEQRQLGARLAPEVEAQRVASLVDDARVLQRRAHDSVGFDEAEVLQLATHLADTVYAREAYVLAQALGELTTVQRERLDLLYDLVHEALGHPEMVGSDASNLAAARLASAQRLLDDEAPIERLRHTATTHLLSHDPEVLARQARLIEPLPRPGVVRVAVTPTEWPDRWSIDVACRDTDGLLSRLTDVLAEHRLEVARADIATWPDGGVVDTFVVVSNERPSARTLGDAFEQAMKRPLGELTPVAVTVVADQHALPWHTVCTVYADDAPGLLHAVSRAFAAAGVVVHSARLASEDGRVVNRFTVSDRLGHKLDDAAVERVRAALAGHAGRRRRH